MRLALLSLPFLATAFAQQGGGSAAPTAPTPPPATSTTTIVVPAQFQHLTGMANYLSMFLSTNQQTPSSSTLAGFAVVVLGVLQTAFQGIYPNATTLQDVIPLIPNDARLTPLLVGAIPRGVLDSTEYQTYLLGSTFYESTINSDVEELLTIFPPSLGVQDLVNYVQTKGDATLLNNFQAYLNNVIPVMQKYLIGLEKNAYPSGIPSSSLCGSGAPAATSGVTVPTSAAGSAPSGTVSVPNPVGTASGLSPLGTGTGVTTGNATVSGGLSPTTIATGAASALTPGKEVKGAALAVCAVVMIASML